MCPLRGHFYYSDAHLRRLHLRLCICVLFEDRGAIDVYHLRGLRSYRCVLFEDRGAIDVSSSRAAELSMCPLRGLRSYRCVLFEDCGTIDVSSSRTAELSMCPLRGLRSSFGEEHGNCLLRGSPRRGLMCITAGVNLRISQTLMASTSKMSHQMLSAFFENIQHFLLHHPCPSFSPQIYVLFCTLPRNSGCILLNANFCKFFDTFRKRQSRGSMACGRSKFKVQCCFAAVQRSAAVQGSKFNAALQRFKGLRPFMATCHWKYC